MCPRINVCPRIHEWRSNPAQTHNRKCVNTVALMGGGSSIPIDGQLSRQLGIICNQSPTKYLNVC